MENPMIKKLTKHGNSLAIVIERAVLDLLKIDADTPLEISTDGQVLVISPVRDNTHQDKFQKALDSVNKKYGRALKRLAE
jgi:antitoxin component of MazEF toxin-antitoxin module